METSELRELAAADPDDHLIRYVLGTRLLDDENQPQEAVGHLQAVLRIDPQHVATYLALGRAYAQLGQTDAARQVLNEGLRISSGLRHGEGLDLVPDFEERLAELA